MSIMPTADVAFNLPILWHFGRQRVFVSATSIRPKTSPAVSNVRVSPTALVRSGRHTKLSTYAGRALLSRVQAGTPTQVTRLAGDYRQTVQILLLPSLTRHVCTVEGERPTLRASLSRLSHDGDTAHMCSHSS